MAFRSDPEFAAGPLKTGPSGHCGPPTASCSIAMLEKGCNDRDVWALNLKVDPIFADDGLGRVFTISTPVRARDGQIETGVRMRPLTVSQVALMALMILHLIDQVHGLRRTLGDLLHTVRNKTDP